jgi:hypothetical protein
MSYEEVLRAEAGINSQLILGWILFVVGQAATLLMAWFHLWGFIGTLFGVFGVAFGLYGNGYRAGLRKGRQIYRG